LDRAAFDFLNDDLDAAYAGQLTIEQAKQLHGQVFDCAAHYLPEPEPLDARVKQMLDYLKQEGEGSLENIADVARLSYKRTSSLFAQNVGLPLKGYLLWKKFQSYELQVSKFGRSRSITEIAHAAGFSDSAHLCRTFQELFSAPPSYFFANPSVRVISSHRHNLMPNPGAEAANKDTAW
jgi:AraC-like DNA-binding protein